MKTKKLCANCGRECQWLFQGFCRNCVIEAVIFFKNEKSRMMSATATATKEPEVKKSFWERLFGK